MMTQLSPEPAIRVRDLEKSYKELHVLRGVNFDVAPGSIFALLGSNGAGKTTMVRILSTLLRPDATATVNGFDVTTHPLRVRESFSLTGQFAAVDEILSGRENLVLVAKLRHLNDPGQVADGLLARFNLADAASRKVSTYSGGMCRRLDIAMSLIGQPKVIFLDEPTSGLDPEGRIEVWKVVQELASRGPPFCSPRSISKRPSNSQIGSPDAGCWSPRRHRARATARPPAHRGAGDARRPGPTA
jgi:ABC-2 type transport system ATP-binding protein